MIVELCEIYYWFKKQIKIQTKEQSIKSPAMLKFSYLFSDVKYKQTGLLTGL